MRLKFLLSLQPLQVFIARGFEALLPQAGTLDCAVCLFLQLFLPVLLHTNVGLPGLPAATLPCVLSTLADHLCPPTSLDECSFFNSSVVGFSYSSIFWQFWLFFVFKFVVVLLLVV